MTYRGQTSEYEVREDETVRKLKQRVEKDLNVSARSGWYSSEMLQDGVKLAATLKLGEAGFDVTKPLHFHMR